MELLRSTTGRILIEGHKGAEGLATPNSWDAIKVGYEVNADLLELDVQRTHDRKLVIYHGYQIPDGRWIRDVHSSELMNSTFNESKIVFLEEVLSWAKNTKIGLSLDIKNGFGFDNQVFSDTLAMVEAHDMVQQVMFLGWDHPNLLLLKKRNPKIKTRILIRGLPVNLVQVAQAAKADVVNLDADMVTNKEVKALHAEGIAVAIAETINPDYSRPVKLDADIICCYDPKQARKVIYEKA